MPQEKLAIRFGLGMMVIAIVALDVAALTSTERPAGDRLNIFLLGLLTSLIFVLVGIARYKRLI